MTPLLTSPLPPLLLAVPPGTTGSRMMGGGGWGSRDPCGKKPSGKGRLCLPAGFEGVPSSSLSTSHLCLPSLSPFSDTQVALSSLTVLKVNMKGWGLTEVKLPGDFSVFPIHRSTVFILCPSSGWLLMAVRCHLDKVQTPGLAALHALAFVLGLIPAPPPSFPSPL